jgi:CheY-like chemotaxis protein
MAIVLGDKQIRRVRVVDDDPSARDSYTYSVEDLGVEPDPIAGPLPNIAAFVEQTRAQADAALIDFHLRKKNYAGFDGAEPTAMLNKSGFPAVLCTRYADDDIDRIRPFRKYIPALLRPDELDPYSLAHGFGQCLAESRGQLVPSRRLWRTLVRVEDIESEDKPRFFYVVVPAWDPKTGLRLRFADLPDDIREVIKPGKRLHARVNVGAEDQEEVYFQDWEST